MSKIRIYDLVKEINSENGTEMKNNEMIAFLNEKGIEVKTASSGVEEEVAQMAKKAFSKKKEEPVKAEEPKEPKQPESLL